MSFDSSRTREGAEAVVREMNRRMALREAARAGVGLVEYDARGVRAKDPVLSLEQLREDSAKLRTR